MSKPSKPVSESTRLIRAGKPPSDLLRTVGPPIQKGSTVLLPDAASLYDDRRPTYGRGGLAAQEALISALTELEGASGVRLFPSGLAAVTGTIMAVVKAGDEILVTDSAYKPVRRFCDRVLKRFGVARSATTRRGRAARGGAGAWRRRPRG